MNRDLENETKTATRLVMSSVKCQSTDCAEQKLH